MDSVDGERLVVLGGAIGIAGAVIGSAVAVGLQELVARRRRARLGRTSVLELVTHLTNALAFVEVLAQTGGRDERLEQLLALEVLDRRFTELVEVLTEDDIAVFTRVRGSAAHTLQVYDEARAQRPDDPDAGSNALALLRVELRRAYDLAIRRHDLLRGWRWRLRNREEWRAAEQEVQRVHDEDAAYREEVQQQAAELDAPPPPRSPTIT